MPYKYCHDFRDDTIYSFLLQYGIGFKIEVPTDALQDQLTQ